MIATREADPARLQAFSRSADQVQITIKCTEDLVGLEELRLPPNGQDTSEHHTLLQFIEMAVSNFLASSKYVFYFNYLILYLNV